MKNGISMIIAFLCIIPAINTLHAANPSQASEITMDDGIIPDLGLSLNKQQSFIITQTTPPEVEFIYGDQNGDHATLTLYFYDYDITTDISNHIIMYQSNVVDRNTTYRILSWDHGSESYTLLFADHPVLGNKKYGIAEFHDGTTLVALSATLNSSIYSDAQLQAMIEKLESKARELLSIEAMDELHGQITGFTIPVKHIKVSLSDGETTNETTTDEEGRFNFTRPIAKGMQYNLTVTFSYVMNATTYFSLHYQENNQSMVTCHRSITIDSTTDLTQNIALDQELSQYYGGDWAKTFASMYVHFTEALEFYKIGLEVDVSFQLPLDIYTFASEQTSTRYWYDIPGKSYITIDAEKSIHESVYRPRNREYHEFSHYMMHTLYQKWPSPSPDLPVTIEERNHDGYLNPSTSDSFVEGFAEFMAAVMLETYQEEIGTIPITSPDTKSMGMIDALNYMYNTQWSGMECDAVAYGDSGRAEEKAIASTLWDLYDENNDYCDKTPEEMYQTYQQRLPVIQKEYEAIKASYEEEAREYGETGENATYPPMKIWTLDDFKNYKWDDDNATLGFENVWDVIKHFHDDFTSVYNELITKYPGQKKVIDEVFIIHSLYVDTNPGNAMYDHRDIYRDENHNKQYDPGEYYVDFPLGEFEYKQGDIIGQSTNYNRQWRHSVQEVPGYFIKVDNNVPFYLVKVSFPNQFYLDYVVRAWNRDGLISIPVPPEGYAALVTVLPENVQCNGPLNFSSEVFQHQYNTSATRGYFMDHDFQVTGSIPSSPSMPGAPDDSTPGDGSSETKTPGFEIAVLLVAFLGAILLFKKRRT